MSFLLFIVFGFGVPLLVIVVALLWIWLAAKVFSLGS